MAGTNAAQAQKTLEEYRKSILDEIESRCIKFCDHLCESAIEFRQSAPLKHNFTGNLLNSIVVCLYREKMPVYAAYAAERVAKAIHVKMTYPRTYGFNPDYDGAKSKYRPEVQTNEGFGEDDAREFFQSYRPMGKCLFDIVVAYPVEYGEWVQEHRGTTGILAAYDHTEKVGTTWLGLQRTM